MSGPIKSGQQYDYFIHQTGAMFRSNGSYYELEKASGDWEKVRDPDLMKSIESDSFSVKKTTSQKTSPTAMKEFAKRTPPPSSTPPPIRSPQTSMPSSKGFSTSSNNSGLFLTSILKRMPK